MQKMQKIALLNIPIDGKEIIKDSCKQRVMTKCIIYSYTKLFLETFIARFNARKLMDVPDCKYSKF